MNSTEDKLMSYFDEVDFTEFKKPVEKEEIKVSFPTDSAFWEPVLAVVRNEINLYTIGQSSLRAGAIQLHNGTCPAITALERFRQTPNNKNMADFLEAASQDFGIQFGDLFRKLLDNKLKEAVNVQETR